MLCCRDLPAFTNAAARDCHSGFLNLINPVLNRNGKNPDFYIRNA